VKIQKSKLIYKLRNKHISAFPDLDLGMMKDLTTNLKYLMTPEDLTKLCPHMNKVFFCIFYYN
jgi:hypothetical protein